MTNALKMAKTVQTIPDNLGLNPRKDRMLTKVITYCKMMSKNGADKCRVTAQAFTNAAAMSPAPLEIHFILAVLRWEDTPHRSKDYRCPSRAGCTGQLHTGHRADEYRGRWVLCGGKVGILRGS